MFYKSLILIIFTYTTMHVTCQAKITWFCSIYICLQNHFRFCFQ